MKKFVVFILVIAAFSFVSAAFALDCTKAKTELDKFICSDVKLKKADDEMGAAYLAFLRKVKDPEFHEAIVKSQRRWLANRAEIEHVILALKGGEMVDPKAFILTATRDRIAEFKNDSLLENLTAQRKLMARDHANGFSGFSSDCDFLPRYHTYTASAVGIGKPVPKAICDFDDGCPSARSRVIERSNPPWQFPNDALQKRGAIEVPVPYELSKYDADVDSSKFSDGYEWVEACLNTEVYPPADQFRKEQ